MKMKCIFFCCSRKGFRLFVQAAKQQAVLLSSECVNGKYLWALPKPAILKKLSKIFYFWADNLALAKFKCQTDNEYPLIYIKITIAIDGCNIICYNIAGSRLYKLVIRTGVSTNCLKLFNYNPRVGAYYSCFWWFFYLPLRFTF